jgi:hypothetical protein
MRRRGWQQPKVADEDGVAASHPCHAVVLT